MIVVIQVLGKPMVIGHAAPPPDRLHTEYRLYKASHELPKFHPRFSTEEPNAHVEYADVHIRGVTNSDGYTEAAWVMSKPEDVVFLPNFRAICDIASLPRILP